MQTFIVRMFDAEDVDGFSGLIEEPATGLRQAFHDAESLIVALGRGDDRVATDPAESEVPAPPDDAGGRQAPSPMGRS